MSLDNGTGGLLEMVEDLATQDLETLLSQDYAALQADIYEIMYRWAGVDGVDPDSRGDHVDARQLVYLERMLGEDYLWMDYDPNPRPQAGKDIERTFLEDSLFVSAHLLGQGAAAALFDGGLSYDLNADTFTTPGALDQDTLDDLVTLTQDPSVDALELWSNVLMIVTGVRGGFEDLSVADKNVLETAIIASDASLTFAAVNNYLYGYTPGSQQNGDWGDDIIIGTSGDDRLDGDDGNDQLYGEGGNDELIGSYANDMLFGGTGDDILYGGWGDDHLHGDAGSDTVYGYLGSDTYYYNLGDGDDSFIEDSASSDFDEIVFGAGITLADLTFTRLNSIQLGIFIDEAIGGGSIILEKQFNYQSNLKIEQLRFHGGSTFDPMTLNYTLNGSDASETLRGVENGSGDDDTIYGHGGNDIVIGLYGADNLYGGAGDDTIYAYGNNNTHFDTDTHILDGGAGFDFIKGADGIDYITGGTDDDTLQGEGGADHYYFNYGDGHDVIFDDGSASDLNILHFGAGITQAMLSYSLSQHSDHLTIYIDGGLGGSIQISNQFNETYGKYRIDEAHLSDSTVIDLVYQDYEWSGTEQDDDLWGRTDLNDGNDTIHGLAGNDEIRGFYGDDVLYGDDGNDMIYGNLGSDTLDGGAGDDTLYGGGTSSTEYSETVTNTFYGGSGTDTIWGSYGADYITGGTDDDTLRGRRGDDHYYFALGDGNDTIYEQNDGNINDTLHLGTGIALGDISYERVGSYDLKVLINGGVDGSITVLDQFSTSSGDGEVSYIELFDTTQINLLTQGYTTYGTASSDTLYGIRVNSSGEDTIYGGDGNDTIYGSGTSSSSSYNETASGYLYGENGNDILRGSYGSDLLSGGDGSDTLYGRLGADTFVFMSGESGIDTIKDFNLGQSDMLDLSDVLSLYDPLSDILTDFLEITNSGSNSVVKVDADGGADNFVQIALLEGITGLTDEVALESSGTVIV